MSAHDVRHLRVCKYCGGLGDDRHMLGTSKESSHGACFIAANGLPEFLALPSGQTDRVALDDIGKEAMKALLERKS